MSVVKEQDHQNNQAGQTAMKRLSKPIKVWVTIAQVLTIFSALLAFVPYLALVWLSLIHI